MIYSISGNLVVSQPVDAYFIVAVECNGIAYEMKTTFTTASQCPKIGESVALYTYLHVREDALELFGFYDQEELRCFKMLISVSGVGPKAALSILSNVTPSQFALCVASGDSKSLTKSKGIGGKIAQRIVLELKDKISKEQLSSGVIAGKEIELPANAGNAAEAISALVVLGYSKSEAAQALAGIDPSTSVEDMIRIGLKALATIR